MTTLRAAKRTLAALGPDNFFVRAVLKAACRRDGARLTFSDRCIDVVKGQRVIRLSKKHMPYVLDMSKAFDHYFEPVVPESVNGQVRVDYSRPRLHQYKESGLEFELSSFPEEASALEGYFRWYRPRTGDLIFDLGAYCGVSTYHFAKLVGAGGRVYAFEPDTTSYDLLLRNIARHNLSNVIALDIGVSGKSGPAEFHSEGALGSGLARSLTRAAAGTVTTVTTITFEEACQRYGMPAFVKVDIEGAEIEMLEAARPIVKANAIHFALDTNHYVDGKLTYTAVEQIFRDCGYEVWSSDESGFMTTWARPATHS